MTVIDHAKTLAIAIRESAEHKRFTDAREALSGDETASKMLEDFHHKQMELQQKQLMGETGEKTENELEKLYEVITLTPKIKEFLEAEYAMQIMYMDIQRDLAEAFIELTGMCGSEEDSI